MDAQTIKLNNIEYFLKKEILVSSEVREKIDKLSQDSLDELYYYIKAKFDFQSLFLLTKEILDDYYKNKTLEDESESMEDIIKIKKNAPNILKKRELTSENNVKVIFSYNKKPIKRNISQFVDYFRNRYKAFESMLQNRNELNNRISISRAREKKEKDNVSIIGIVSNKSLTKNNNILITLEDMTGTINVIVNKNRADELFFDANCTVLDEVIGVSGVASNGVIFADRIIMPDIPKIKVLKKAPYDEFAAFLGDPHFGSKEFLQKEFSRLINWFNGKVGDDKQKEIASKIKFLFIVGDIVDGVGIYPSQEADLSIPDIYEQYSEFTNYLKKIPQNVQIIICPGNHDAMRIAEPQPPLYEDFAKELYTLPNVIIVSNPSLINIGAKNDFNGFDILLYHGYSFTYYADTVEYIRSKGGMERADLIMQLLLRKRHLAPSHTSNLYIPDAEEDPLIISKIPDFFVSGHIHRTTAKNFNGITLLNCSCWIGQTAFQEKVGLKPQPARLPIVNLSTREIKIMKFGKEEYTLEKRDEQ